MEKLKLHSKDLTAENIEKLAALFPNCVTETKSEDGTLKNAIDFDLLRQELSADLVEGPQERYRLDWPGKREALATANAPIAKTLRPCREESVNFDSTKNLYIEGDNLEALKLLQETYLNKVKLIYIDPPYNTGHDFVYEDDFAESSEEYFSRSNQKDNQGNRLLSNSDTNGRFHSDWMSMMLSRLRLARNLLREDGVIFISIDDGEVANLRKLGDQIFGEKNFVGSICWQKRYVSNVTAKWLSDMHDHILIFARNRDAVTFQDWERSDEQKAAYKNPDKDKRGVWRAQDLSASKPYKAGQFEITGPTGNKFAPPPNRYWRCNNEQFERWTNDDRIWWGVKGDVRPMLKSFLGESTSGITPHTWWTHKFAGHNKEATLEVKALFDGDAPFDTAKPTKLIRKLLELIPDKNEIVLDFFSGSATTAHAVMQLNAEDDGKRRHIMVQLPEACAEESGSFKAGYATIAEIGKERIRRAGAKIRGGLNAQLEGELPGSDKHQEITAKLAKLDTGFRVLKVDTSNMADVYYRPDEVTQDGLGMQVENIKPDRSPEDLLFQVLLDWGVDLALPIEQQSIAGKTVFFVDSNALAACFDPGLDEDFVKELAKRKPLRAVFRDASFATDSTKINIEQIFKALSPHTELKTI